jgi:hypothetical protein
MRGKKKFRIKGFLNKALLLAVFVLPFFAYPDGLCASAQPAPISGMPLLWKQRLELLRNLSRTPVLRIDKDILNNGDFVGRVVSFWAFDFHYSDLAGYYQTAVTCRRLATLSTGHKFSIYVENGQLSNPNKTDAVVDNIQPQFIQNIVPTERIYFGGPPAGDFTILILDIKDTYDPPSGNLIYVAGYKESNG